MSWNKFIVLELFIPISKPQRSKSWNKNWKMFGLRTANFPNYFSIEWKPFDDLYIHCAQWPRGKGGYLTLALSLTTLSGVVCFIAT